MCRIPGSGAQLWRWSAEQVFRARMVLCPESGSSGALSNCVAEKEIGARAVDIAASAARWSYSNPGDGSHARWAVLHGGSGTDEGFRCLWVFAATIYRSCGTACAFDPLHGSRDN